MWVSWIWGYRRNYISEVKEIDVEETVGLRKISSSYNVKRKEIGNELVNDKVF